jgi:hypothetical protein
MDKSSVKLREAVRVTRDKPWGLQDELAKELTRVLKETEEQKIQIIKEALELHGLFVDFFRHKSLLFVTNHLDKSTDVYHNDYDSSQRTHLVTFIPCEGPVQSIDPNRECSYEVSFKYKIH